MSSNVSPKGTPPNAGNAEGQAGAVLAIEKLSHRYDAAEDRLVLEVEDAGGRGLRMWLTRRLGDALFGHIGRQLTARGVGRDPEFARHMQVWEQQAAQAQLRRSAAVARHRESVLLSAVDVTGGQKGISLVFKASLAGITVPVAQVTLNELRLRQWLGIVFRIYSKASWPVAKWPEWVVAAQQPASADEPADGAAG